MLRERLGSLWTRWPDVILVSGGSNITQVYLRSASGGWIDGAGVAGALAAGLRDTVFSGRRLVQAVPVLLIFPIFFSIFTSFKYQIPELVPFTYDPLFIEIDGFLHGGKQPWEILQPVIGFAAEPGQPAYVVGLQASGVGACAKHWPGHGSSLADPHVAVADVTDTWRETERAPFAALLKAGKADMIMTGHVHHRDWGEGDGRPASLSPAAIQLALRQTLGFDGVVVTDDLQMESALAGRSLGEAVVLALAAGNDVVLIANMLQYRPDVARYAIDAIKQAVAEGRLDAQALKRSYRRVLSLKQRLPR